MVSYYYEYKVIVLTGFKNPSIKMVIDYDDVNHKEVNEGVTKIVDVLNEAQL